MNPSEITRILRYEWRELHKPHVLARQEQSIELGFDFIGDGIVTGVSTFGNREHGGEYENLPVSMGLQQLFQEPDVAAFVTGQSLPNVDFD